MSDLKLCTYAFESIEIVATTIIYLVSECQPCDIDITHHCLNLQVYSLPLQSVAYFCAVIETLIYQDAISEDPLNHRKRELER